MLRKKTIQNFCLAFFFCILACADATAKQASQQDLDQLKSDIRELQRQLDQFKGKRSSLRKSLRNAETSIGSLQKQIRKIKKKLSQQQKELKTLQAKRNSLLKEKKQQQQHIADHIVAAYQIGLQKKLKVLLNQEQPDKLSRALTYYDYLNRERSEYIEQYTDTIDELNTIEPQINERTQALQEARDTLISQRKQLTQQHAQREKSLQRIDKTIQGKDEQLQKMQKDRQQLEQLLNAVEETIANLNIPSSYQPFKKLKGKMLWPTKGRLSKRFGQRRNAGLRWQGVMISGKEGSPVQAIHHGRIVFADWFRGKGLLTIIDHGNGFMSLYAHNQSLLRETGDWVNAGETIATVGNSGGQHTAGLYFEIRHNGRPTNPKRWCRKRS